MTSGARSLQHEAQQRRAVGTRSGRGWHPQEGRRAGARLRVVRRAAMHACMLLTPQRCSSHLCLDGPSPSLQGPAQRQQDQPKVSHDVHACIHHKHARLLWGSVGQWQAGAGAGSCREHLHAAVILAGVGYCLPALVMQRGPGSSSSITGTGQAAKEEAGGQQDGLLGPCMHRVWGRRLDIQPNSVRCAARLSPLLTRNPERGGQHRHACCYANAIRCCRRYVADRWLAKLSQAVARPATRSTAAEPPGSTYRLHSAP